MKEYNTLKELEEDIKKGKTLFDYIKINGIIYTQDMYDSSGKEITYSNKSLNKGFIIETEDRYKFGFGDSVLNWVDTPLIRNDIYYMD